MIENINMMIVSISFFFHKEIIFFLLLIYYILVSFENEEEAGEDSSENPHLARIGPSEIEAYLKKRGLKQGFNAWAGKRSAQYKNRRAPWGGK